mgnify:FL=1
MKNYLITNIALLSHFLNTLTGGSRFYTFSARSHYCAQVLQKPNWVYVEKLIDKIFFFHNRHCMNEYYNEKQEKRNPI